MEMLEEMEDDQQRAAAAEVLLEGQVVDLK